MDREGVCYVGKFEEYKNEIEALKHDLDFQKKETKYLDALCAVKDREIEELKGYITSLEITVENYQVKDELIEKLYKLSER